MQIVGFLLLVLAMGAGYCGHAMFGDIGVAAYLACATAALSGLGLFIGGSTLSQIQKRLPARSD